MKTKILSKDCIELNGKTKYNHFFDCSELIKENHWQDCPITTLRSKTDSEHYYIKTKSGKIIPVDKSSQCLIYKILHGHFSDSYLLVESNYGLRETSLYILNHDKTLNFATIKQILTIEEIENILTNKTIAKRVANIIKTFDVSRSRQTCESFCENLPIECLKNDNFLREVSEELNQTQIKILGAANLKFIDIDACFSYNLNIFKHYLNIARNLDFEI